ncbi:hypothetical protein EYB25_003706 [Talaromyces marneffei]|nr:hypothetical protein EYB25_003706 [Talaromyces marneffei]
MIPHPTTTSRTNKRKRRKAPRNNKPRRKALYVRTPNLSDNDHEKTCTKSSPMTEGYTFVPKGDPYITRHCKSRTKDEDMVVYIVYDAKLRRQLGIRVPSQIHTEVLESANETAAHRASATLLRDRRDNVKSRALLLATFPAIPPQCLEKILQHAFLKGSGRVGRISTRTETEKATLAVEAHIRHEHTEYERLMEAEGMEREGARGKVWENVKRIGDQWLEGLRRLKTMREGQ